METNWKPIENLLGRKRCVGFMYMGRVNGISLYKHGITRTYLNLDDEGNCYIGTGSGCYSLVDFEFELKKLGEILKGLHATLQTPYDDVFIARKQEELGQLGIFFADSSVRTRRPDNPLGDRQPIKCRRYPPDRK
jgi:hypothetical protein